MVADLGEIAANLTEYRPPGAELTLSDLLLFRAVQQPQRIAYRIIKDSLLREDVLTYLDLHERALAVADGLRAAGLGGKRIVLLHHTSVEFLAAFFGTLYAGSIAVPLNTPASANAMERLDAIFSDVDAAAVLTSQAIHARVLQSKGDWSRRQTFIYTESLAGPERRGFPANDAFDFAVIQYTSGSTSAPKGVELSHYNFLHNASLMAHASGLTAESVGINWLPLFHDMGLMGGVIQPLFAGFPITLLSPTAFLARPILWLQAITKYRATVSGAPDFGYAYCTEMIEDKHIEDLDLRTWDVAYSGAEPVRAGTLDRFVDRFSRCGFRRRTFFPCYGLAEATLIVSGGPKGIEPTIIDVSRPSLEQENVAISSDRREKTLRLVSSGCPIGDQTVLIVDPNGHRQCGEGAVGEIWVKGRSVGAGYRNRAHENQETFRGRCDQGGDFLRTGDLGFFRNGHLFVVGRIKDLIVIRGVNHFPEDIELSAAASHVALRSNGGAAFGLEIDGKEELAIVYELKRNWRGQSASEILDGIRQTIADQHGLSAVSVTLVAQGTLPKTTSGKIQRHSVRDIFLSGRLQVLAEWRSEDSIRAMEEGATNGGSGELVGMLPVTLHALLIEIWSAVLKVENAGIDDNFFDLGGQSSQLINIQLKLNKALKTSVPVTKLFQYPTIRSLSADLLVAGQDNTSRKSEHADAQNRSVSRQRYHQSRLARRKARNIS
jgi:acyl-CoA synthetase (AMP-forming)/AMP-acid ligase II/acyl carrier protein